MIKPVVFVAVLIPTNAINMSSKRSHFKYLPKDNACHNFPVVSIGGAESSEIYYLNTAIIRYAWAPCASTDLA